MASILLGRQCRQGATVQEQTIRCGVLGLQPPLGKGHQILQIISPVPAADAAQDGQAVPECLGHVAEEL